MNFSTDVTPTIPPPVAEKPAAPAHPHETVELLRQLLEVQREQLQYQRAAASAHDMSARWRAYLARWQQDFPHLGEGCRKVLPLLERSYGKLLNELAEVLSDEEALDNDFAFQEFLDRYYMRLAQLTTIMNQVAQLAEAGTQNEPT